MGTFAVIPMKDQWEYTRDLVAQLDEQGETDGILVIDNGSERPASQRWLDEIAYTHTVFRKPTWNLHEMWNLGIAWAQSYGGHVNVALLNNDLRIGPHFMSGLARGLCAYDSIWVVCPNYDSRDMHGADLATIKDICAGRYDGTGGLCGFAFMLRGELVGTKLPWFDEELQWYCGDNQLVIEVEQRGGKMALVGAVTVEHLDGGSRTLRTRPPEFQQILNADMALFARKYDVTLLPAK